MYSSSEGFMWKRIAESLRDYRPSFRANNRAASQTISDFWKKKFIKRRSEDAQASGIDSPGETEVAKGLQDITESFHNSNLKIS